MWGVRLLFMLCLMAFASGCRPQSGITLHSVGIAQMIGHEASFGDEGSLSLPDSVVLALDVENRGVGVLLREGRVRVSYRGRRVAMFTLGDKVRIKGHGRKVIYLPFRVNVARNSQSVALWQALRQHESEHISLDWEASIRVGVLRAQIVQSPKPLEEVMPRESATDLWREVDKMFKMENGENF